MTIDSAFHNLTRDLTFTLRKLRRSPGFALTTILTLTLAISANLIVFGVLNALLFHPLPIAQPRQVFQVQAREARDLTISYPNYRDLRDRNHSFSSLAVARIARIGLSVDGNTQPVWGYEASGNYFSTLGVQPFLGRFFLPAEDTHVNGSPVVVLSFSSWQVRFAADPGIIGKPVLINKHPYTIIGVAPRNFNGTERFLWPEIWVPYNNQPEIEGFSSLERRGDSNAWVIGRLASNVTADQANADLTRVALTLVHDFPRQDQTLTFHLSRPGLGGDALGGPVRAFLLGVMLMALLVLIAACANLGGLFAARTADRSRELGIRVAIGSSRAAILRQLLLESLTISAIGGVISSFLAALLLRSITHWHPANVEVPVQFQVEPDATVYLAAALLALFTGLFFGILPARQVWKTDPNHTLRAAGSSTAEGSRVTVRSVLLVVQVALCALLVTSSFVAVRGLNRTFAMPLGITPQGVSLATLDLSLAGYKGPAAAQAQQSLADAIARTPGITAVAYASSTPLSANRSDTSIFAPGTTDFGSANAKFTAQYFSVSPTYFAVAGTPLLRGRAFTSHDDDHAPLVVIVNETFARRLFGTADTVGQHFPDGMGHQYEVVGIVEDGKYATLSEDPTPASFWPILQSPDSSTVLLTRSQLSPEQTLATLRATIAGFDPGIPVFTLNSWPDALSLVTFPARAATIALGVLGALAILLALTGTFSLANYSVSRRMREFGIRVALGAQSRQLLRTALERTAWLLAAGSLVGLGLGIAAGKLLASIVYHATSADPVVIAAALATMAALGLFAAALPARRALRVDPAHLLRDQ